MPLIRGLGNGSDSSFRVPVGNKESLARRASWIQDVDLKVLCFSVFGRKACCSGLGASVSHPGFAAFWHDVEFLGHWVQHI